MIPLPGMAQHAAGVAESFAPRKDGMRSLWLSTDIDVYILAFIAQADAISEHGVDTGN